MPSERTHLVVTVGARSVIVERRASGEWHVGIDDAKGDDADILFDISDTGLKLLASVVGAALSAEVFDYVEGKELSPAEISRGRR